MWVLKCQAWSYIHAPHNWLKASFSGNCQWRWFLKIQFYFLSLQSWVTADAEGHFHSRLSALIIFSQKATCFWKHNYGKDLSNLNYRCHYVCGYYQFPRCVCINFGWLPLFSQNSTVQPGNVARLTVNLLVQWKSILLSMFNKLPVEVFSHTQL